MSTCPKCQTKFTPVAGQPIACPGCGRKFKSPARKPEPVAVAAAGSTEFEPPPSMTRDAFDDMPPIAPVSAEPPAWRGIAAASSSTLITPAAPRSATHRIHPPLQPRRYMGLEATIIMLRLFCGLILLDFLGTVALFSLPMFGGLLSGSDGAAALGAGTAIGLCILSAFAHGITGLILFGLAELLTVVIDIQGNTHEAAYYAKVASLPPSA